MVSWLESLPTLAAGIVVVGGFVVLSLFVGYIVAQITSDEVRKAHNELAGFILAVIGVIYAVLLAFVAIGVWERFQVSEARTYDEAGALSTVYRDSEAFPQGEQLRREVREYTESVIKVEWPLMRSGEEFRLASPLLERVAGTIRSLPVGSARLQNIQAQMLTAVDTALADRDARLTVDSRGINGIIWWVLLIGAVITVGFTYLFGFHRTVMQAAMVGSLSLLVGLVIFLVIALDFPYRGSISVQPEAFRAALDNFNIIGP
jgi:Protein of unknown function (DUF4239)